MKRTLLTIATLIIACAACFGQNMPKLHNESIESSKMYQKGNVYQKDLLLYVDMLGRTHPYYADSKHLSKLNKDIKRWWKSPVRVTPEAQCR